MEMKEAMEMAANILDMFGDEDEIEVIEEATEEVIEEEQKAFDEGWEEMFKDVPDNLEGDGEEEDPEWDEGVTEEQKEEGRREIRTDVPFTGRLGMWHNILKLFLFSPIL